MSAPGSVATWLRKPARNLSSTLGRQSDGAGGGTTEPLGEQSHDVEGRGDRKVPRRLPPTAFERITFPGLAKGFRERRSDPGFRAWRPFPTAHVESTRPANTAVHGKRLPDREASDLGDRRDDAELAAHDRLDSLARLGRWRAHGDSEGARLAKRE